jgi:hypothetical protein
MEEFSDGGAAVLATLSERRYGFGERVFFPLRSPSLQRPDYLGPGDHAGLIMEWRMY